MGRKVGKSGGKKARRRGSRRWAQQYRQKTNPVTVYYDPSIKKSGSKNPNVLHPFDMPDHPKVKKGTKRW